MLESLGQAKQIPVVSRMKILINICVEMHVFQETAAALGHDTSLKEKIR